MHVYQIVQFGHGIERRTLRAEGVRVGRVTFEYSFAYGIFGYGHSDQLRNTDLTVFELINDSFFLRIRSGEDDKIDNKFWIRTPHEMRTLTPNSFVYEAKADSKLYTGKQPKNPSDSIPPKYFTNSYKRPDLSIQFIIIKVLMSVRAHVRASGVGSMRASMVLFLNY